MPSSAARIAIIALSCVALVGCTKEVTRTARPNLESAALERMAVRSQDTFYNHDLFVRALESESYGDEKNEKTRAIVVPHHLLASEIIAQLFSASRHQAIDTIVILGPNHNDNNATTVATAHLEWQTPLGAVLTDSELVASLVAALDISELPEAFLNEHSVGAIVPFVRHYFPEARIVPIIFNSTATLRDAERVSKWLADNLDAGGLVVVSTDFSHYLTEEEADRHDRITEELIRNGRIDEIIRLNNDYVDSPASVASVMLYARAVNLIPQFLRNANSNDFSERAFAETTSYFGIAFTEE